MKKIVAVLILTLLAVSSAYAEKVKNINTTGWTQTQKNMAKAALIKGLADAGRPERPTITPLGGEIYELSFPDSLPDGVLNQINEANILQEIADIDAENAAAAAAELADFNAKKASIRTKLTTGAPWTNEEVTFFYRLINSALNN